MAEETTWNYEKLDDDGKIKRLPMHDADAKITGQHVMNLQAWMDENPEERIRLGWTKHIHHKTKDIEYDRATQFLQRTVVQVDEWTVEDVWEIVPKSEEMMRLEELSGWQDVVVQIGGDYDFD